jgi:hypothetical protein
MQDVAAALQSTLDVYSQAAEPYVTDSARWVGQLLQRWTTSTTDLHEYENWVTRDNSQIGSK